MTKSHTEIADPLGLSFTQAQITLCLNHSYGTAYKPVSCGSVCSRSLECRNRQLCKPRSHQALVPTPVQGKEDKLAEEEEHWLWIQIHSNFNLGSV